VVRCAYSLVIRLARGKRIKVGSLGDLDFEEGLYVYTGSDYRRVRRHLRGEKKTFWHIDYLLKDEDSELLWAVWCKEDMRVECKVNQAIFKALGRHATKIPRFGSSDCRAGCGSHLIKADLGLEELKSLLLKVYSSISNEVEHL